MNFGITTAYTLHAYMRLTQLHKYNGCKKSVLLWGA